MGKRAAVAHAKRRAVLEDLPAAGQPDRLHARVCTEHLKRPLALRQEIEADGALDVLDGGLGAVHLQEGEHVLQEEIERRQVHLLALPMDDVDVRVCPQPLERLLVHGSAFSFRSGHLLLAQVDADFMNVVH